MDCCSFDIIEYLSGMTGYVFDRSVLKRIAVDRGILGVRLPSELNAEMKEKLLADLLTVVVLSPDKTASYSVQHGNFMQSVGSQTINDKQDIIELIRNIRKKYGEEDKLVLLPDTSNLQWLE